MPEFISDIAVPVPLFVLMLGMGMTLSIKDFVRVFTYPRAFLLGFISLLVIVPALGFLVQSYYLSSSKGYRFLLKEGSNQFLVTFDTL